MISTSPTISNSALLDRIGAIKNLPTLPKMYDRLVAELSKSDVALNKVSTIVSQDIAISAKLLQVVNSALFGLRTPVESTTQALNLLGVESVRGIVLAAGVYNIDGVPKITGFLPEEIYGRAVEVGTKARFIAYSMSLSRSGVDDALTAGLLHDVGKLVLLTNFASEFREAIALSESRSIPLYQAQEQVLGASDAAIGAYLLTSWGLPKCIVEAVGMHYTPSKYGHSAFDAGGAVHLAWASEQDRKRKKLDSMPSAFDLDYVDAVGLTSQLQSFVNLSPEAVSQTLSGRS